MNTIIIEGLLPENKGVQTFTEEKALIKFAKTEANKKGDSTYPIDSWEEAYDYINLYCTNEFIINEEQDEFEPYDDRDDDGFDDDGGGYVSHTTQSFMDRADAAREAYERGDIDDIQRQELSMGA